MSSLTKEEIEQIRVGAKELMLTLAESGLALGKTPEQVSSVRNAVWIDALCDLALAALDAGSVRVSRDAIKDAIELLDYAADDVDDHMKASALITHF
jgi:hypothetical protein